MKVGLIGFGGVGKALIRLINEKKYDLDVRYILKSDGGIIEKEALNLDNIVKFENDIKKHSSWIDKLTLSDVIGERVDVLIELTPTNKETGEPAMTHIKTALKAGINVVTGNKGPIYLNYKELKNIADKNNVELGIGCTTGGALPTISTGVNGCAGSEILAIEGILNGTSNYILSVMHNDGVTYEEALRNAQILGIAETNPLYDVKGYDTAIKTIILGNVLMGLNISLADVEVVGIENIKLLDIEKAKERGEKIKVIGSIQKDNNYYKVKVGPRYINEENPLYFVDYKNKGVSYYSDTLGRITVAGGESGTSNAAAAILRDVINIKNGKQRRK